MFVILRLDADWITGVDFIKGEISGHYEPGLPIEIPKNHIAEIIVKRRYKKKVKKDAY